MAWLYSLYWLGALAAVGPILFHMWRRMPRGERQFSTLMFLTPSPPRITSRSRVEHWLLLLLRAGALALLAFAFTRPLWRTPIKEPDETGNESLVAILVDTSASMRRTGIWDNLLPQLDERLAKLPPQTQVALYRFDRAFVPVADFPELKSLEPTSRRQLVRARLKELKPTWESTRLGEALVATAARLQEAQTERAKPALQRVWLVSDLQSGSEVVALQGYEWPDDIPVELILAQPTSVSNAGLQVVERNPEAADDQLRVRITNSADSRKEQFVLKWDSPASAETGVYVPPGQSRVLTPPKLPVGVSSSSLILKGDDDDFDNRVFVAESAPDTRLVVYSGPESASDTDGARFYLDRLFAASHRFKIELRDLRDVNQASADAQPSLIVMTAPDSDSKMMVHQHLENGGTILIAAPTPEMLLGSLALCGRDGIEVTEADVSKYSMLGDIDFEHPVFTPFAESQFSDFTGIRFWKHRRITGIEGRNAHTDGSEQPSRKPDDSVLARFDDGDPAIIELPVKRGRLILFASGWQPADSQFARSSKFPMLIFRLLEHSNGIAPRAGSQDVGSELAWPAVSQLESTATGTAKLPDGTESTDLPLDRPFGDTRSPGIYTLTVPGRSEQVAVNLAADESRTSPLTLEQLESFGLKLKGRERLNAPQTQHSRQRQLQLAEMEQSQKLWQRILMVVLMVLLLETFVTGWFGMKPAMETALPERTA
jgi:hypothetical protein